MDNVALVRRDVGDGVVGQLSPSGPTELGSVGADVSLDYTEG